MKQLFSYCSLGLTLVLLLGRLDPVSCGVHYIVSETTSCNTDSCLTFSQLADSPTNYVATNTTLYIVGGSHYLDREISISHIEAFAMIGINSSITCSGLAKFIFASIGHVHIGGLTFIGCGSNRVTMVDQLTVEQTAFWGQSNSRTSILISDSSATILESSFHSNTVGSCEIDVILFTQFMLSTSYPESLNSCTTTVGGVLIVIHSTLFLDNSHFEGNSANLGGAIYSKLGSNITINNSYFLDNHAADCDTQLCFGGVLFAAETASVSIFNSTFQNNTSDGDGGVAAILFNANLSLSQCYIDNNSAYISGGALATYFHGSVTIENTKISFCTAESNGGAIYASYNNIIKISDSTLITNSASNHGGVLFALDGNSITATNVTVLNNTASSSGAVIYGINLSTISVSNSIFEYNTAFDNAGVIRLRTNSTVTITNTTFSHNKAELFGGAIALREGCTAVVSNSSFYHNTADKYGGAIEMEYNSSTLVTDTSFDSNFAMDEGGVFDAYTACSIEVYGSTFSNNNVNINGGVLTIKFGTNFYSENCSFSNNSARDNGAVLFADNKSHTNIHNCSFMHNSADNGGVLAAWRKSNVTIDNSWFISNTAFTDGATIYSRILCTTTIHDSNFINNVAINNGVLLVSASSDTTVENSCFTQNEAGHDGGVAYVYDNSALCMNNCSSIGNTAGGSGGVVYGRRNSIIELFENTILDCKAQLFGGSISIQQESSAIVEATTFTNNSANTGGVMRAYIGSTISIINSTLSENMATISGGVMGAYQNSTVTVHSTDFTFNRGSFGGVAFVFDNSTFVFEQCQFLHNVVEFEGMFKLLKQSSVAVLQCFFKNNTGLTGGVAFVQDSSMVIESSNFEFNGAREKGGVIYVDGVTTLHISASNFINNTVENDGGVMTLLGGSHTTIDSCSFTSNTAKVSGGVIGILDSHAAILNSTFSLSVAGSTGGVMRAINSSVVLNNTTFVNNGANINGGVVDARINSSIELIASRFFNNMAKKSGGVLYLEEQSNAAVHNSIFHLNTAKSHGGAISVTTASKFNVVETTFSQNAAEKGAAISVRKESFIFFDDDSSSSAIEGQSSAEGLLIQIYNNTADLGGGIYLVDSTLYFKMGTVTIIDHNLAHGSGGGVHAFNSSITIGSTVKFEGNQAMSGGGVSLASSKLYDLINDDTRINVNFISNYATDNGGALYVEDEVDSTCSSESSSNSSGCFFQNLTNGIVFNFDNNYADSSGHDLFGGLLDRCSFVSDMTDLFRSDSNGVSRFEELSNLQNINTVSSEPVRVCPCKNGKPDCSQQEQSIQIRRGDRVLISIVAVDQVKQPVTAVIQSSFNDIALPESQTVRKIGSNCTTVDYDVAFPNVGETHQLTVFAEGPCNDNGISKFVIDVKINSCVCPLGFMPAGRNSSGCACDCDRRLSDYITECDISTKSVIRKGLFWITYLNDSDTDGFFIYPYCPLDYCQPPSNPIPVNLSLPQGSDAQCANNHRGVLCGSCQPGYSLSLGGSKCTKCPSNWYGFFILIIISSLLAGVVLVVILLVLNLTVAIGTMNSIIFYANIIYSNRRVYFGQSNLTFIPVFISWLNLDIGIDTCFFEGMDAYAKTWLQLAFPVYIIFLVFMIIWVSSCSSKFSRLLGKRDPVATLATLILLSYTKLLETIITTFSFATFRYSNHTTSLRWFPDANIEFSKGKHIALICVAVLILLVCLVYTTLIFMWQWFLHCSRSKLFKWTKNHKLHSFINTYHTPHNAKHRYWTGMLLLLRVIVYIITAVSASSDQPITPLSTVAIMCCLSLYKTALIIRVYKNWLLNSMEVFVYFNIAIFALITSYTVANPPSQNKEILHVTFAYLSVGATLILFMIVIAYHAYRYGCSSLYTSGQISKFGRKIRHQGQSDHSGLSVNNDILDAIDNPRARSGHTNIPTRTVIALANHEKSTTAAFPPNQPITPEEHSLTMVHSDKQEQGNNGSVVNTLKTFTSKSVKATMQPQGATAKRAKPKLLYYSAEHRSENITKPLLNDEDKI